MSTQDRIPARLRLRMADINNEWKLLISWLPGLGEVSEVDAATLVEAQWERTQRAYSAMGLEPHTATDMDEGGTDATD